MSKNFSKENSPKNKNKMSSFFFTSLLCSSILFELLQKATEYISWQNIGYRMRICVIGIATVAFIAKRRIYFAIRKVINTTRLLFFILLPSSFFLNIHLLFVLLLNAFLCSDNSVSLGPMIILLQDSSRSS